MSELEVEIKNTGTRKNRMKDGIYLATFIDTNDRIVFFKDNKMILQIDNNKQSVTDELHLQSNSSTELYKDYRKIKKVRMEIELE